MDSLTSLISGRAHSLGVWPPSTYQILPFFSSSSTALVLLISILLSILTAYSVLSSPSSSLTNPPLIISKKFLPSPHGSQEMPFLRQCLEIVGLGCRQGRNRYRTLPSSAVTPYEFFLRRGAYINFGGEMSYQENQIQDN